MPSSAAYRIAHPSNCGDAYEKRENSTLCAYRAFSFVFADLNNGDIARILISHRVSHKMQKTYIFTYTYTIQKGTLTMNLSAYLHRMKYLVVCASGTCVYVRGKR